MILLSVNKNLFFATGIHALNIYYYYFIYAYKACNRKSGNSYTLLMKVEEFSTLFICFLQLFLELDQRIRDWQEILALFY